MTAEVEGRGGYLVRIKYRVAACYADTVAFGRDPGMIIERVVNATSSHDAVARCANHNRAFLSHDATFVSATCEAVVE